MVDMPVGDIVGRATQLGLVSAFLDGPVDGPAGLGLDGESGIGKSTLWRAGVAWARERGMLVLSSRPAEAERGLAHVGLGDLFDDVFPPVAPRLSAPRRRALEAALLRGAADEPVDQRALGVAVHDLVRLLCDRESVLLAVDDVQWLDASSARALAFALRRLDPCPVRVLIARRLVDASEPSELECALGDERLRRVPVDPLGPGALHGLLRSRLGKSFARQTLLRIHDRSGGNPFFALELARDLEVDIGPLEPMPVPQTLDALVHARLAGLPRETQGALAFSAALGTASLSLLARAGIAPETLAPAVASHVIELENGRVRFTHPLLSSVLCGELGTTRSRGVHRSLAAIMDDPLDRARHLALSAEGPDAEMAAVLDDAAALAVERGVSAVAAELAEHAARLTPADRRGERRGREVVAARAHRDAGEWTRARSLLTSLLAEEDEGSSRAEALALLADLEGLDRAVGLLDEALRESRHSPALRARIQCRLAWAVRMERGFVVAHGEARAALDMAEELGDPALRVEALMMLSFLGSALGDPEATAQARRAHELAGLTGDAALAGRATVTLADALVDVGERGAARAMLEREYELWKVRDEPAAARVLVSLAWLELADERWELAAQDADQALELNLQYGLDVPWNHLPISAVAVHRGDLETARAHSELALRLAEQQFGLHTPVHLGVLGIVASQSGDLETADSRFGEAAAVTARLGWRDAGHRWWVPDHVEALLELGRLDHAAQVLDDWEADAARLHQSAMLAHAMRCRGLLAAARGQGFAATSLLEQAVAAHESVDDHFGRARALLALGVVRRRAREKRAARTAIAAALADFERLGATRWAETARGQLGHIGGRTRIEGLTAAERRVAALVMEGRTNREVAAALFLSERTVETHLTHVYAKLGIRSRGQLAIGLARHEQGSGDSAIPT
jgi:DNA-binding CsgD family transcriptional regulator